MASKEANLMENVATGGGSLQYYYSITRARTLAASNAYTKHYLDTEEVSDLTVFILHHNKLVTARPGTDQTGKDLGYGSIASARSFPGDQS